MSRISQPESQTASQTASQRGGGLNSHTHSAQFVGLVQVSELGPLITED